jgi:tetratricopeptide (TPR) repeat protein
MARKPHRLRAGTALAAAAGALALLIPFTAAAQQADRPDPRCARGAALEKAGEKKEARKAYLRTLRRDPSATCAVDALKTLGAPPDPPDTKRCTEIATALKKDGDVSKAREEYAKLSTDLQCAKDGLAAATAAEVECERGDEYRDLDRDSDAEGAYKEALKKVPNDGLDKSDDDGFFKEAAGTLDDAAPVAFKLLAGLLFLVALLALVAPRRFLSRRLGGVPVIGRLFRPGLAIAVADDALETKVGAPLAARISGRLQWFREEAAEDADYHVDFGTSDEELADLMAGDPAVGTAVSKLGEVSEQAKMAGAVLELLLALWPRLRLRVEGILDPAGEVASGTFTLRAGSRVSAMTTIEGPELSEPAEAADFLRLADTTAVTPNQAESYSLLRKGLDVHLNAIYHEEPRARFEEARAIYELALLHDDCNWAAHVNLAVITAHLVEDFDRAIEITEEALAEFEARGA